MNFSERRDIVEKFNSWLRKQHKDTGYFLKDCAFNFIIWLETTDEGKEIVKKLVD